MPLKGTDQSEFRTRINNNQQDNAKYIEWPNGGVGKQFKMLKYIDVGHNHVRSLFENGQITLAPNQSKDMKADFITKALLLSDLTSQIKTVELFS